MKQVSKGSLIYTYIPEIERHVSPKRLIILNRLHGVTFQKIEPFNNNCCENVKSYNPKSICFTYLGMETLCKL
jgi:hypothetical protein